MNEFFFGCFFRFDLLLNSSKVDLSVRLLNDLSIAGVLCVLLLFQFFSSLFNFRLLLYFIVQYVYI